MLINKIIIEGNSRLLLNNIRYLELTFTAILQVILGTNGSGKSTLKYELSPLPPEVEAYGGNGSKRVWIDHDNSTYVLSSIFTNSKGKHSFIKDGVELNDSGLITIQRELVNTHFRYTQEIHDVMCGKLKFTKMSTLERKKWLTLLSKTNLTNLNRIWRQSHTLARDGKGALKHISNRLASEVSNQMSEADLLALETETLELKNVLTVLMENKEHNLPDYQSIKHLLDNNLSDLQALSKRVMSRKVTNPVANIVEFPSKAHLDDYISTIKQAVGVEESLYSHYCNEFSQIDSLLLTLNSNGSASVEEYETRLEDLNHQIDRLTDQISEFNIELGIEDINVDTESIGIHLIPILRDLPVNNGQYSSTLYEASKTEFDSLNNNILHLTNRRNQIVERITHIREAHQIDCPACNHKWIPGVNSNDLGSLETNLEHLNATIASKQTELDTCTLNLTTIKSYMDKLASYKHIVSHYPRLKMLWDRINNRTIIYERPEEAIRIVNIWISDVGINLTRHNLIQQKIKIEDVLSQIRLVNNSDSGLLNERVAKLQDLINASIVAIEELKRQLSELNNYRNQIESNQSDISEIEKIYNDTNYNVDMLNRIDRNKTIVSLINEYQGMLAIQQKQLIDEQTTQSIIIDLKGSFDSVNIDTFTYQLLTEVLGPTEGLIAEFLSTVIQNVVGFINNVISSIWTVPLLIQDCGLDKDGELDYKFPMRVETTDAKSITADISEGSSAQVDIVDFAFVLLIYFSMEYHNYPLWIDELGVTFDETHRQNLMAFIRNCIESKQFSQTFMISHYADQYRAFINSETLVLDSTNVLVPHIHNLHAVFK